MSNYSKDKRPLSPHLSIYKPQITSVMSISHRITGMFMSGGLILFAIWIYSVAYNNELFVILNSLLSSIVGMALLFFWTLAIYYHLGNGLRHLFWDTGRGFELESVTRSGYAVIAFALIATGFTWFVIFAF